MADLATRAHDALDALRKADAARTPGEWRANDASEWLNTGPPWEVVYTAPDDDPIVAGEDVSLANYLDREDAAFIAHLANTRAAVLDLIAATLAEHDPTHTGPDSGPTTRYRLALRALGIDNEAADLGGDEGDD